MPLVQPITEQNICSIWHVYLALCTQEMFESLICSKESFEKAFIFSTFCMTYWWGPRSPKNIKNYKVRTKTN